jgi:hypothetical protein
MKAHPMKKRLPIIVTGIGAIALALGLFWIDRSPGAPRASAASETRPCRYPDDERVPAQRPSALRTPLLEVSRLVEEAVLQEEERTPSTMAEITESVLEEDPELAEFHRIREKSLRTKAEKQQYHGMLADPVRIHAAKEDLLAGVEADEDPTQEEEMRRILQLEYLTSAMDWTDNPRGDEVRGAITDVLLAELPTTVTANRRGSVLGDKIDMYQHLLVGHPGQARIVRNEATGTPLERLFDHAEKMLISPTEAAHENHTGSGG